MGTGRRRSTYLVGGAVVVVLAVAAAWLLWPDADPAPARERQYKATTACLLTDDKGITAGSAGAVWAGMQDASLATHVKVQYLAVNGPQTTANALSYFNSLGARKCAMILAVGTAPVGALREGHAHFPDSRYVAVGGDPQGSPVTTVPADPPSGIRPAVAKLVSALG